MNKNLIIGLLAAVILVLLGILAFTNRSAAPITGEPVATSTGNPTSVPVYAEKPNLVRVQNVANGSRIASPVTVKGEARGYWFFEASFPVEIRDENGRVLGGGIAEAQEEWMTENYVPFTAVVSFNPGTATKGYIALIKDNPSGLPENDDELLVPVSFGP
jgi:hypothetical protein